MNTPTTTLDPEERLAWLALASVDGIGEHIFSRLVGRCGGAAAVLRAARLGELRETGGAVMREGSRWDALVERIEEVARDPRAPVGRNAREGLWAVTPLDAPYPPRLHVLDPPPPVLYGRGDTGALAADASVAIVGTRRPTPAGRTFAGRVATALAHAGFVVVSGLAVGIDGTAHAAAVDAGGRTVAVIGAGHDRPGPRAHRALLRAILEGAGAVVSELRPDAVPTRGTFPRRNRLISALADAVLVIEAPLDSGALITARHALEQGRPLFAMPGRPGDRSTAGCLALLRETPAQPLLGPEEVLADLGRARPSVASSERPRMAGIDTLAPVERLVAEQLSKAPASADRLVAATGLGAHEVAAALSLLQLRGWARVSGASYLPAGPLLAGHRPGRAEGRPA